MAGVVLEEERRTSESFLGWAEEVDDGVGVLLVLLGVTLGRVLALSSRTSD